MADPVTGGLFFARCESAFPSVPWRQRFGADPGRVALPLRRRAGDGAVVPPPRRGGEDGSPACARLRPPAEARIPRQPGLLRAASRRLAGTAWAKRQRVRIGRGLRKESRSALLPAKTLPRGPLRRPSPGKAVADGRFNEWMKAQS